MPDKDKQELSKNGINSADDYANKEYYKDVNDQVIKNKKTNLGGMGSSVSKGIDAATSIVTGLITGDITGGLAGASAPYLAEQIKKATTTYDANGKEIVNTQANLIAHAILGAAVAQLQGNSALAGGVGAVTGEAAADIIRKALYGDTPVDKLSEAQKENISALAQLASGLAVAGSGGSVSDIGTAVAGSKNAVENNFLDHEFYKDYYELGLELFDGDKDAAKDYADNFINKQGAITLPILAMEVAAPIAIEVAGPAMSACAANPVLCANEVAIWLMETIGAEGMPSAGLGMTTAGLANSLTKTQLKELSALLAMEKKGIVAVTPEIKANVKNVLSETLETKTIHNQIENVIITESKVIGPAEKELVGAGKGTSATQLTIDKNKFAVPDLPGVSQSRVNVANVTYDNGKVRGFEYAMGKHGVDASVPNKSRFVIANDEVKVLLQRPDVVNKPVYNPIQIGGKVETDKFVRQVDVGKTIGVDQSGKKTSVITIITDRKGNLINTFPGKL